MTMCGSVWDACAKLAERCTLMRRDAAWFYKCVHPAFVGTPKATAVTLDVYIDHAGVGTATIGIDGSLVMRAGRFCE